MERNCLKCKKKYDDTEGITCSIDNKYFYCGYMCGIKDAFRLQAEIEENKTPEEKEADSVKNENFKKYLIGQRDRLNHKKFKL